MTNLYIHTTDFTPGINFNLEANNFEVSGVSRPEDVRGFFDNPLGWLREFEESVLRRPDQKYQISRIRLIFKMAYFNSSSSKYMIQMLKHFKHLEEAGITVTVDWYYDEGDENMREDGEELADAVDMTFNYIDML